MGRVNQQVLKKYCIINLLWSKNANSMKNTIGVFPFIIFYIPIEKLFNVSSTNSEKGEE